MSWSACGPLLKEHQVPTLRLQGLMEKADRCILGSSERRGVSKGHGPRPCLSQVSQNMDFCTLAPVSASLLALLGCLLAYGSLCILAPLISLPSTESLSHLPSLALFLLLGHRQILGAGLRVVP